MKSIFLLLISLFFAITLQAQVSKTAEVTSGNLKTTLTIDELNTITNLTLTGTIDARDFKTMRDDMPVLSVLDLNGVTIASYSGNLGTAGAYETSYPTNAIPQYAFFNPSSELEQGKTSLTLVLIPSSVTSIGSYAFLFCNGLVSVIVPSSVISIGEAAFLGTSGLIDIHANNPNYQVQSGVLYNKTKTNLIQCSTSKTGSFFIPSSVTSIGLGAFYKSKVNFVSIPSSVTSIGQAAFYNCNAITTISVHSTNPIELNSVENVFSGMNKTTCILNVPYGAKGLYASTSQWKDFKNIVEETNGFILSSNRVNLASEAGSHPAVTLSANVAWTASSDQSWLTVSPASGTENKTITFTAEANTSVLSRSAKITFSAAGFDSQILLVKQEGMNKTIQVTAGGLMAALTGTELSGISNLKLTGTMDARDFKMLRDTMPNLSVLDLSDVTIASYNGPGGPSGYSSTYPAKAIPTYAFYNPNTEKGKSGLTTVTLPLSLVTIDYNAFMACTGLTSVNIPSAVITIGSYAFSACTGLASVSIPASVNSIQYNAFSYCSGLISVNPSNPNYSSLEGVLFNKNKTSLIQCPISKTGIYTIPSTVTFIESGAFISCSFLTSVIVPSSVTSIANNAFNGFDGLISVDTGNSYYSSLDGVLFDKYKITIIKCPISKTDSYVIPSTVTTIGEGAFDHCSLLSSVTIPLSVTSFGNSAFAFCSGLTSIVAKSSYPVDLKASYDVFHQVNQTSCTLNVPFGAKKFYAAADQWKDFTTIVEEPDGFIISPVSLKLAADEGSNATVNLTANVLWTATSDQSWLTLKSTSGFGNKNITVTATANSSLATRTAKITVSATDILSQTITVTQAGVPIPVTISAGGLSSALTASQLSQVTSLIVTGTMDARDFKTLRENMPFLAELDLSSATIVAFSGTGGTYYSTDYPANTIPQYAFYNLYTYPPKSSLTSVILPASITSIAENAFGYCKSLTSITIPPTVTSIGSNAFYNCSGLTSIYAKSSYPVDLTSSNFVFNGVNQNACILNVPYASKARYSAANQWKDFTTIVVESQGFVISPTFMKLTREAGSNATATISANISWSAASDQSWLTVNPTSGTGDKLLTVTAEANVTVITRTAKVTFSATGVTSQKLTISQEGQPKPVEITPGTLSTALSAAELEGVSNLIVTGTIDARDFKTMRDKMPLLSILNLSGAKVVAYTGNEGTSGNSYSQAAYSANAIPEYAFYNQTTGKGKTTLTSVALPSSVTSVRVMSFYGCSGLSSITIPSSVNFIGSYTFYNCNSLTSIILPSSLISIENSAFYGCSVLTNIAIPPAVTSIGSFAFSDCSGLTSVTIPSTVNFIGANAFYNCINLTSVSIPSLVTSIENWAFSGCKSLTSVTIPSSVTSIGGNAFWGCWKLTSVTIPSSVTSIGDGAFYNCIGLTSLTIPTSVRSIGSSAFGTCLGLTSINANSSHPVDLSSSPDVFSGINKTTCKLNVPYKAKTLYAAANQWKDFTNINEETQGFLFDQSVLNFSADGGVVGLNASANVSWTANSDQSWLTVNPTSGSGNQTVTFTAAKNPTSYTRTAKVTVSAAGILSQIITVNQQDQPKTIEITPGALASILNAAELTGNTNLTITGTMDARDFKTLRDKMPMLAVLDLSSVTIAAYTGTEGLTDYENNYPANEIPMFAFYYQNTNTGKTSLTSVKLPSSVYSIGSLAFYGCSGLTSITIPSTVTSIAGSAFMNCSGLTSIFANSSFPVDLNSSGNVFYGVNKTTCTLNVPYNAKALYVAAYQWQDFTNMLEAKSGFTVSSTNLTIAASAGSTATVNITGNVSWTVSPDQTWLKVTPTSGTGTQTHTFTVEANATIATRTVKVTVSATGVVSQTITVNQKGQPKTIEITPGALATILTADELNGITNLILTGTMDARDFKTLRDKMPLLEVLDLSGSSIVSYSGNAGTTDYENVYPANGVPVNAFYYQNTGKGKTSLSSVVLPSSLNSIEANAFYGCTGLSRMTIPLSVTSINNYAFYNCTSLTSIVAKASNPVNLNSTYLVFSGVNKTNCKLNVPYGSKSLYASAYQWQDFTNIVEEPFGIWPQSLTIAAPAGSTAKVDFKGNVSWTVSTDQTWLTVLPVSGTGNQTLTFTAEANPDVKIRTAKVTVSVTGVAPQTIMVSQEASAAPYIVTAGKLKTLFTSEQLGTITKLKLSGTLDARDFKTMRDDMPLLAELDLSGVTIVEYIGTEGTYWEVGAIITYPANEIPIIAFRNQYFVNTNLTSVILPENATSIGWDAFCLVTKLKSIVIPPTVTKIDVSAFAQCPISTITIPASVEFIGVVAFSGTDYINVEVGNPNYCSIDGTLYNKAKTTLMQCPHIKTGTFTMPPSVTRIDDHAFEYSYQLAAVNIPSSVTSISHFAFLGCISLTSITIPSQVTFLGDWAFSDCTGLTSIYSRTLVPVDLSKSKEVFLNVNKTTCTLYVPAGTKALYAAANLWKDFKNIVEFPFVELSTNDVQIAAPQGSKADVKVTSDVSWTVSSNQSWLTVDPNSGTSTKTLVLTADANPSHVDRKAQVTVSATGVVSQIIDVTQAASPVQVTAGGLKTSLTANDLATITKLTLTGTIDARDFKTMRDDMPNLSEIDLSGVKIVAYSGTEGPAYYVIIYPANEISELAFFSLNTNLGKSSLTNVTLPTSVTSIGDYAFQGCTGLTSFTIPSSVTSIDQGAFYGFRGLFIVAQGNLSFSCSDNVLFNKSQTKLIQCSSSRKGSYNIPSTVSSVGDGAFIFCSGLTSVNIPSSVVSIGNFAFQYCNGLLSLSVNSGNPIDLNNSLDVFYGVNKTTCSLYVPYGTKVRYASANQWKDFTHIVEEQNGFVLSSTFINLSANEGSSDTSTMKANVAWTVSSDQTWLTINPASGNGNQTLTFTAKANSSQSTRLATVTISASGLASQKITILQDPNKALISIPIADYPLLSDGVDYTGNNTAMTLTNTPFQKGGIYCNGIYDLNGLPGFCIAKTPFVKSLDLNSFLISVDFYVTEYKKHPVLVCGMASRWVGIYLTGEGTVDMLYNNLKHVASSKTYELNKWHNAKVSFDGKIVKMYLDNSLACYAITSLDIFGVDTQIGVTNYGSAEVLKGYIKNLIIYNLQAPQLSLSAYSVSIPHKQGSTALANITSNVIWTASSDQHWLTVNPTSGTGTKTLTFTAEANPINTKRTATVTVSAQGLDSQTITITQNDWPTDLIIIAENSIDFNCYPNPFSTETTIKIRNPKLSKVTVDIYNLAGERIKNLVSGNKDEQIDLTWNGTNDLGNKVAPGVYICKMNNQSKYLIYR